MMEGEKLQWMYKNSSQTVDNEEYLLGRPIDKNFENALGGSEIEKDCLPPSIFAGVGSNIQVDVDNKKKEDPLESIRQKEIEVKKQLLKNPIKLKKLQEMVKRQQEELAKTSKKKKKKKKSKDLDKLLAQKYLKLMKNYDIKSLVNLSDSSSDDDSKKHKKVKKKKERKALDESLSSSESSGKEPLQREHKIKPQKRHDKSPGSSCRDEQGYSGREAGLSKVRIDKVLESKSRKQSTDLPKKYSNSNETHEREKGHKKGKYDSKSDCSPQREIDKGRRNERYESDKFSHFSSKNKHSNEDEAPGKKYGLLLPKGVEPRKRESEVTKVRKKPSLRPESPKPYKRPKPVKMSEEEKEKKLKEMMSNAKWRDDFRSKNMKRYHDEEKREKLSESKEFDNDFVRKQMSLAAKDSSVEQRIKSKINSIQRPSAMSVNFARKY